MLRGSIKKMRDLKLGIIAILSMILISGCSSTYETKQLSTIENKLDGNRRVLVSTPKDGRYGSTLYQGSGEMTANAVKIAFSRHALSVDLDNTCPDQNCLSSIDSQKYGYYVKPDILHWEDRATEWSGKSDRIEIRITVYDAVSKSVLVDSTFLGKSKWATFGGDHPQDLLPVPTEQFVNALY
jgi:Domain of unknown function (DUF4823)